MSAGTLRLTNNSTAVVGTGTTFTTDLKVNDFVVTVIAGVTYTLAVAAIASNTALTLNRVFNGPTTATAAWTAVPNAALVGITAQVAADTARMTRQYNLDKDNWNGLLTQNLASVTVNMADGSTYTGPSWQYVAGQFTSSIKVSALGNVTINNLGSATSFGVYSQAANANATAANGYPFPYAGTLSVTPSAYGCQQRYETFNGYVATRGLAGAWNGADGPWSNWVTSSNLVLTIPNGTDLNSMISVGSYISSSWLNSPVAVGAAYSTVDVSANLGSAYIRQTLTATTANRVFIRRFVAGAWSDWVESYTTASKPLLTDLAGVLPAANGGTGSNAPFGTAAGKFAQGNDSRLNTIDGKSGGAISGNVSAEGTLLQLKSNTPTGGWPFLIQFMAGQGNNIAYAQINQEQGGNITIAAGLTGTPRYFSFLANGNMTAPGNITCVSLTQTSDATKKDKKEKIENALEKVKSLDGITFVWKETGLPSAGIIAQQLKDVLPESIGSVFEDKDEYGEVDEEVSREITDDDGVVTTVKEMVKTTKIIRKRDDSKRSYTVEYSGVVALLVEAVKELSAQVDALKAK